LGRGGRGSDITPRSAAGIPFDPGRSDPAGPGAHRSGRGDAGRNPTDITLPTVPTGGQITVGGPPGGAAGASGAALAGTTAFTIAPKGRTIAPA
jgi:hypothetical protein